MTDSDLIKEISEGGMEIFNSLVLKYYESLNAFAYHFVKNKAVSADIVQDVFTNLWMSRHKLDFNVPLKNYLYVSVRNLTYNYIRSNKRVKQRLQNVEWNEEDADMVMIEEEVARILKQAIDQLPSRNADVIRLSMAGVKQQDIADRLGISLATVKALKSASIKKLKEIIGPISMLIVI